MMSTTTTAASSSSAGAALGSPTPALTEKAPKRARRQRIQEKQVDVTVDDFCQLQAPHPYGVLPGGNRFFAGGTTEGASADSSNSNNSNSAATDLLNEECWNAVLSFLDGADLGRLAQTGRFLYVAAHQPEFWRDLVLQQQQNDGTISQMGPSWKDTYVLLHSSSASYCPHTPMPVPGIFSDYYYRLHSCRSFALPQVWLRGSDDGCPWAVPQIAVAEMTAERFVREFERPNRPVVIRGAARGWPALAKWRDPAYCARQTENQTFRATSGVAPQPAQFTWDAYQAYCRQEQQLLEEGPLYLFDRTALRPGSALWKDYMPALRRSCPYWDPEQRDNDDDDETDTDPVVGHDLFGWLGEGRRPDHTWLIAGPPRSGSVFHIDPNATHAWNAAIVGRKRWIFYPPGGEAPPPGVHPSPDGDRVALPLTIGEWLFQFWEAHRERRRSSAAPASQRPLEVTARPGDVVFVPHGWWHMVINLDDAPVNIAITHNYVSRSNLPNVLKFLDRHRDQVSGCRDRPETAIQPEHLYESFVEALRQRRALWLAEALAEADWTCRAWRSSSSKPNKEQQPENDSGTTTDDQETTRNAAIICSKKSGNALSVMEKAKSGGNGFSFSFV